MARADHAHSCPVQARGIMATVTVGLIGGSGLLKTKLAALQQLREEVVDTVAGRVFLRTGALPGGAQLVFVQRHDATVMRTYTQPADINYSAILLALKAKASNLHGVKTVFTSLLHRAATMWLVSVPWGL